MRSRPTSACRCNAHHGKAVAIVTAATASSTAHVPSIGGQRAPYIAKQLADFRSGRRVDPNRMMDAAVALLDPSDDAIVAAYFAAQAGGPVGLTPADAPTTGIRRLLTQRPAGSPGCVDCHGGEDSMAQHKAPRLRGQNRRYIERQLHNFRSGMRNNDQQAVMRTAARALGTEEIQSLAAFLAAGEITPSTSAN